MKINAIISIIINTNKKIHIKIAFLNHSIRKYFAKFVIQDCLHMKIESNFLKIITNILILLQFLVQTRVRKQGGKQGNANLYQFLISC